MKTTVVLAALLAAVGVFYYVYEIRLAPGRERAERDKGRLWSIEARDVEEVVLKRRDGTVHLKREGDSWQLQGPVTARAEKTVVQDLVANLVSAKADREIDPSPPTLTEFGLDNPAAEIAIRGKGKGEPLGVALGAKSPTGLWVYARTQDKPAVFLLSDTVLREATKPVADFRDRTILSFDRKAVTSLEVASGGQLLVAEPDAGGGWRITRPTPLKADGDRIGEFLDKLLFTKVKEFVAEAPRAPGQYGLDQPARVTVWLGREKDRNSRQLLLGKVDAARKGVYALRPGEQAVLLLGEEIGSLLPRTVDELRDKTVVSYERDKLAKLTVESPKGTVTVAREGQEWRITTPEPLKADGTEVNSYLWKLQDLRAQAFVAESAAAVSRYLAKPEVRVSLWPEGAPAPKTLLLGPSAETRDGARMAYAAVLGQGPVALVDARMLRELAASATDLRDRSLLGLFDARDVKRLQIRSGGQAMLVERQGESDWHLLEPRKSRVREGRVNALLFTLRGLKWREQVAARTEEGARYGLDQPPYEVTLWKTDGSEIGTLVVGRAEQDRTYVRSKASPAIYAVEGKPLGTLPRTPDDLQ